MRITISNYRAITADNPLTLDLSEPVTFLLGQNNIGKSSILKFFAEMKDVLLLAPSANAPSDHKLQLPYVFWDSLANRRSLDKPIQIRVEAAGESWSYTIVPDGSSHTQKVRVRITPSVVRSNSAIANHVPTFQHMVYFGPVRSTNYSHTTGIHTSVSGSNLISTWADWSAGDNISQQRATEQVEEEIRQLFGFKRFSMRVHKDKHALIVAYDEGTFRLTELGDGLSHFITVLANALVSRPSYLLLDEPENGLHPKMQALFVQTMATKCSKGLVATSHSMGLARSVADKVFYCTRSADTGLSITDHKEFEPHRLTAELREMSYSQMIESGEQNILLVEGRTDVKAFRQILKAYGIEDRFIIVSLGGGDLLSGDASKYREELEYLKSFGSKNVIAIIDSEKNDGSDSLSSSRASFKATCESLGYSVHILERRALENYVPQVAIDQVLGSHIKALAPFARFTKENGWKKSQTWKIISATPRAFLDETDLGTFVRNHLIPKAGI